MGLANNKNRLLRDIYLIKILSKGHNFISQPLITLFWSPLASPNLYQLFLKKFSVEPAVIL